MSAPDELLHRHFQSISRSKTCEQSDEPETTARSDSDFGACSESLTVQLCENVASRTVCCQMPTGTVVVAHAYSTRTKFVLPHYLCLAAVGAGLPEGAAQTDRHFALEKRRMAAQPVHRLHSGC